MTLNKVLLWAAKKLNKNNIDSASLDAEILLSLSLQKPKEYLYTHPDQQLTKKQLNKFNKLIKKRVDYEPIAYLTGQKEFYGLMFVVNKHVLVPRPESETIIDEALKIIKERSLIPDSRFLICDIGTGSGCLIISLTKELQKLNIIDKFELIATDISRKALKVAKENAKLHQVDDQIIFIRGNLLKPVTKKLALNAKGGRVDLIITNLPYLSKADIENEASIKKEPKKALLGNYDKFFRQVDKLDKKPIVIFEDKKGVKVLK